VELILDAARLLLEALSKNEIQIQQLADQKIGQTVNLIRKNNKEIAPVKTMLRNVVQKMQDLARRGDSNAGGRPRPNGTTVNGHTNEVKFKIMTIDINFVSRDVHQRKSTRKFRDRMESQRMELL